MSKEGLPKSLEEALDREEQEALDKVTTYHRKIGLLIKANYIGVGLVYLGSAVASIYGYPICLAGNIVTLPAALLLSRKLDHMDHKFWKENLILKFFLITFSIL